MSEKLQREKLWFFIKSLFVGIFFIVGLFKMSQILQAPFLPEEAQLEMKKIRNEGIYIFFGLWFLCYLAQSYLWRIDAEIEELQQRTDEYTFQPKEREKIGKLLRKRKLLGFLFWILLLSLGGAVALYISLRFTSVLHSHIIPSIPLPY